MKKINNKSSINKLLILIAGAVLSLIFITLVIAETTQSQEDLQTELDGLVGELGVAGYDWLIDYNISYPSVEVFREGDNVSLAVFENINS